MAARTLTDGEREIVAELNADAYDPDLWASLADSDDSDDPEQEQGNETQAGQEQ
jgi:hypothetical protein